VEEQSRPETDEVSRRNGLFLFVACVPQILFFERVVERTIGVSHSRKQLETTATMSLVGVAAVRRCAALAASGQVMDARITLISTLRLMQRGLRSQQAQRAYISFIVQGERLDGFMREMLAMQETKVQLKKDDYVARNLVRAQGLSVAEFCVA
jgi:hypothetical protein